MKKDNLIMGCLCLLTGVGLSIFAKSKVEAAYLKGRNDQIKDDLDLIKQMNEKVEELIKE